MEQINILHRDIRPLNILVSNDGTVKIIDFGFGKMIEFDDSFDKSITLNWLYTTPNEFEEKIYDFKTEIYFIGKLFEAIIIQNKINGFAYNDILKTMIQDYSSRINTFFDVSRKITEGSELYNEFQHYEKNIYRRFADVLVPIFSDIDISAVYHTDIKKIVQDLESIYQSSMLEENIQNVVELCRCFVKGGYKYWRQMEVPVDVLKEFTNFFRSLPLEKQKIVLTHLWKRLDTIDRDNKDDELPF